MIAAPTGASWSMMIRSHFSQLPESRAHVARCASLISSALGIAPPAARARSTVGQAVEDRPEGPSEAGAVGSRERVAPEQRLVPGGRGVGDGADERVLEYVPAPSDDVVAGV